MSPHPIPQPTRVGDRAPELALAQVHQSERAGEVASPDTTTRYYRVRTGEFGDLVKADDSLSSARDWARRNFRCRPGDVWPLESSFHAEDRGTPRVDDPRESQGEISCERGRR